MTYDFFFAVEGKTFRQVATGLTQNDVGQHALRVLSEHPAARMFAKDGTYTVLDYNSKLAWKWTPAR